MYQQPQHHSCSHIAHSQIPTYWILCSNTTNATSTDTELDKPTSQVWWYFKMILYPRLFSLSQKEPSAHYTEQIPNKHDYIFGPNDISKSRSCKGKLRSSGSSCRTAPAKTDRHLRTGSECTFEAYFSANWSTTTRPGFWSNCNYVRRPQISELRKISQSTTGVSKYGSTIPPRTIRIKIGFANAEDQSCRQNYDMAKPKRFSSATLRTASLIPIPLLHRWNSGPVCCDAPSVCSSWKN